MIEATTDQNSRPLEMQNHSKTGQIIKPPSIGSKRQYRLILAILDHPEATNLLSRIIGANNVPDVVKKLRARGWSIKTLDERVTNRDGERVNAGAYELETPSELAKKALNNWRIKHPLSES